MRCHPHNESLPAIPMFAGVVGLGCPSTRLQPRIDVILDASDASPGDSDLNRPFARGPKPLHCPRRTIRPCSNLLQAQYSPRLRVRRLHSRFHRSFTCRAIALDGVKDVASRHSTKDFPCFPGWKIGKLNAGLKIKIPFRQQTCPACVRPACAAASRIQVRWRCPEFGVCLPGALCSSMLLAPISQPR